MPQYSSFAFVLKHVRSLPCANRSCAQLHDCLAGGSNRRPGPRHMVGFPADVPQTRVADFDEMFWPQVVRGIAIMFCLLPPTRLALGAFSEAQVPDATGLFNLMRNLGGAIGIALIDTILYGRSGMYAEDFRIRLLAGDV